MSELKERIQARIEKLTAERDQYLIDANKQLAAYNAVIAELTSLLEDEPAEDDG
jgi:chromosome condensin MukBEF ATPase and DNA-binding subunit MukB